MMSLRLLLLTVSLLSAALPTRSQHTAPALPSDAQLAWHETGFYIFLHFGPNTFTNLEWGHGTETEDLFNPSDLDVDQWCRVALAAGARGIIITAKHHDGFCLWPSRFSTHTVRESPWKNGQGDVLRELSDACRRHGLKFGVYLSPWDRNHPQYGTPEYNDIYASTLTELLTGYGPLFEVWWDGANGEGPNGKKQEYDFHRFEKLVAQHQPDAIIFSDIGPGCRWAGNEQGTVGETNWCRLDTAGFGRGATGPPAAVLQSGQENGQLWIPAECDVSIRPGWFYHPEEDDKVKTPEQLFAIYLKSVGRGANLILNVPPDRRGRIHERDSVALSTFGQIVRAAFDQNLAARARVLANGRRHKRNPLTDGDAETGMALHRPDVALQFAAPQMLNCVVVREHIRYGQTVRNFSIEARVNDQWQELSRSTTIGNRKILVFPAVQATALRLRILDAGGTVRLSEIQAYRI